MFFFFVYHHFFRDGMGQQATTPWVTKEKKYLRRFLQMCWIPKKDGSPCRQQFGSKIDKSMVVTAGMPTFTEEKGMVCCVCWEAGRRHLWTEVAWESRKKVGVSFPAQTGRSSDRFTVCDQGPKKRALSQGSQCPRAWQGALAARGTCQGTAWTEWPVWDHPGRAQSYLYLPTCPTSGTHP